MSSDESDGDFPRASADDEDVGLAAYPRRGSSHVSADHTYCCQACSAMAWMTDGVRAVYRFARRWTRCQSAADGTPGVDVTLRDCTDGLCVCARA